jgi:hypothetical protein
MQNATLLRQRFSFERVQSIVSKVRFERLNIRHMDSVETAAFERMVRG